MKEGRPHLIILQGAPGVGRTTLANRLAKDLSLRLVAKDDLKEALYEKWNTPTSVDETKLFGRIAIRSMYIAAEEYLRLGQSVMIEAPLEARFAVDDIAAITHGCRVLQLHLYCQPEVQVARFSRRIEQGTRHSGHIDTVDFSLEDAVASQNRNQALPGFDTISIDTTQLDDDQYKDILSKIKEHL